MKILCDTEGQQLPELEKMTEGAALCIHGEGIAPERAEVSLSFVTGKEIRELNRQYRGIDQVTDVLSFPQYADLNEIPRQGELLLGDVVICTEQARAQAEEFGHSLQREIVYLFIHSICHLLGYDHMEDEDRQQMRQKEETIMEQLGLER